jgi:hypothetical protein
VLRRTVHLATVVFWISVPLLGMALIFPWLRYDWLQHALAILAGTSATVLLLLTYSPDYVSPTSLSIAGERFVYGLVLLFVLSAYPLLLTEFSEVRIASVQHP